jgi:NAD(P)-dependent dehydrogenase (short-subunit alcohol dehydrogenase family)
MSNILITGANRGIGLELTRQLSERGESVTGVCRQSSQELEDCATEVWEGIDVGMDACVSSLREKSAGRTFDWVINNAGILRRSDFPNLHWEDMRAQFEVNSLGPLRVVAGLRDSLGSGGKVGIVTSRMGSVGDNTSGGAYGYRMSKAAVNMAGVSLAHELREQGIAVALLHPGWVQTDMTGHRGQVSAEDSAKGLIARLDQLSMETSGQFWHASGEDLPW